MSILDLLPQTLFVSLVDGSIFALVTIGFSFTYSILKFPNIAQAAFITFGSYIAFSAAESWKLGFYAGMAIAFLAAGLLGILSYELLFRPLAKRTPGFIAPTVTSIGLNLALTYIFEQIWGRSQLYFSTYFQSFQVAGIFVNWLQLGILGLTGITVVLMHLLLTHTKFGAAMRATSSNPELVRASGIKTSTVILYIWFLGSALAGLAGVLVSVQTGVTSVVGSNLLVTIIAVAILAGLGSFYGVIAAAFVLSFAENLSVPLLIAIGQPVYYNIAVAYIVVVIVMLYFPAGFSGTGPRLGSIFKRSGKLQQT